MTSKRQMRLLRNLMVYVIVAAVSACSNGSTVAGNNTSDPTTITEFPVPGSSDLDGLIDQLGDDPFVPELNVVASSQNSGAVVFSDSGLILLPRSLINEALNDPGAIREVLFAVLGEDFPQAASWTFHLLDNSDPISSVLFFQYGLFVPDGASVGLIVIGDAEVFLDQLFADVFGEADVTTRTVTDVIADVVTSSTSVSATGGSY